MKICVFGTGYVGLVTSVCFSEMGNTVHCVDVDSEKIKNLQNAKSPIYELGLESLLKSNLKAKRIHFTTEAGPSIQDADVIFIAVGTPSREDGSADLQYVFQVAETIAENMSTYKLIVTKSTVPVGTSAIIKSAIIKKLKEKNLNINFDVASNPEFLREGCAIEDCLKPNRVVIGVDSDEAHTRLQQIYDPFLKNGNPLIAMDPASAEMTKYAANAMLATKISLMNEFSKVCEKLGADIESVRKGIGTDFRIGPHFIYAGVGYGGSCFPKDVKALIKIGADAGENLMILDAVKKTNDEQRVRFIKRIYQCVASSKNKIISVWGVSFKPGTDDIREAPAIDIIHFFLKEGFKLQVFDPVSAGNAREYFQNHASVIFFEDQYQALQNSCALVIPTEWKSFREPDFEKMKSLMDQPIIFDGRNIYSSQYIQQKGFQYFSVGRPS